MSLEAMAPDPILQWMDEHGVPHRRTLIDKIFLGRVCQGIDKDKRIINSLADAAKELIKTSALSYLIPWFPGIMPWFG